MVSIMFCFWTDSQNRSKLHRERNLIEMIFIISNSPTRKQTNSVLKVTYETDGSVEQWHIER